MSKHNYTLMEILVTIAIIAVLASIGVGVFSMVKQKSAYSDTETSLARISNALKATQTTRGMPDFNGGMIVVDDNNTLPICGSKRTSAIFIEKFGGLDELKSMTIDVGGQKVLADYWGRPFIYTRPGLVNRDSFDLVSAGADGLIDGEAVLADDGSFNSGVLGKKGNAKEDDDVVNY